MRKTLRKVVIVLASALIVVVGVQIGSAYSSGFGICTIGLESCLDQAYDDLIDGDPNAPEIDLTHCIALADGWANDGLGIYLKGRIIHCIDDAIEEYEDYFNPDCWDQYVMNIDACVSDFVACVYTGWPHVCNTCSSTAPNIHQVGTYSLR